MKRTLLIAAICLFSAIACSSGKDDTTPSDNPSAEPSEQPSDEPSEEPSEEPSMDVMDTWNGHFIAAIADSYDNFEQTDELLRNINVDGLSYGTAQYTMAACYLVMKIDAFEKEGTPWWEEDVEPGKYGGGSTTQFNSWDRNVITRDEIVYLADKTAAFTEKSSALPNYVTFEGKVMIVGTEHDRRIAAYNYSVILARTMKYFKENGKLPEEISSWPSDYLHSSAAKYAYNYSPSLNENIVDCPVDDERVIAVMNEAIEGCTTDREKAEAIFAYTRDRWEWENYANTHKGAIRTIKEKGGNCSDLTHATVAMCRAAGIPARYLHGQCYFSSGVIGHVIPEIYVDGEWWICDPSNNDATWGVPTWKGMETLNSRYVELPF